MNSDKIIVLGKNSFIVTATINTLIFKQVEKLENNKIEKQAQQYKIVNQFTLNLTTSDDINEFKKLLNNSYEQKVFTYKNLTFDFTSYERKSVDCILDQLSWIEKFIPKSYLI